MDILFAAYSTRYLTISLGDKITYPITRRTSRGMRVLWYMGQMGGGWLSEADLTRIGAGFWRTMKYVLPDLLRDELIDKAEYQKKNGKPATVYKINRRGLELLEIASRHVEDEYQKAVARITSFKDLHGIRPIER